LPAPRDSADEAEARFDALFQAYYNRRKPPEHPHVPVDPQLMFTTPGLWHFAEWYPLPVTNDAGFFLMKDIFLLGAAIWTAGEALGSAGGGSRGAGVA
jgi:hypothetical protein